MARLRPFRPLASHPEAARASPHPMLQSSFQVSVFPPVIKNLLIINGLVFMAQIVPSTDYLLSTWFALWPIGAGDTMGNGTFLPWQLVTYAFLHANLTHVLFNMLALWMFGVQIENSWGSRRFALFYFVCVVGAGLVQLAVTSMSPDAYPTVGASGGVFGVLLAFGMMFPEQPIYVYFFFPIKAKWFVVIYGVLELYAGVVGGSTIAHFAHLGGMLFGWLLILYWRGRLPWKPRERIYW